VLSRKIGESIVIDDDITIIVSTVQGGRVKLCIEAPRERRVARGETSAEPQSLAQVLRPERPNLPGNVPQLAGS
jgi:carbon storage regulator